LTDRKLGIIGCGNMGEALLAGLLKKNVFDKKNITVSEKQEQRLQSLKNKYSQIAFVRDNRSLVKNSSVIILAVKPQDMETLLKEISPFLTASHLIISIAAGIKISFIEKIVKKTLPTVRVMSNLPALVGEGMSVYSISKTVSREDEQIVEEIFGSVGKVLKLEEDKLDAVTALSGSGPAYISYMLEEMVKAGCELGLTEEQSKIISLQTLVGTTTTFTTETYETFRTFREKITSPKGTTEAALKVLMDAKWKEVFNQAIKKAEQRSKELSK
jgi:pyrroline-5-carboxylate reductase